MNLKLDIKVCRVCLKSDRGISLYSEINLAEKFQYSTQIKIKPDDGMPTILCERCFTRLKIAYEFKRQSIISDQHLRTFISKVNNQFKEVANTTISDNKEVMTINEDEMEILIEEGYKPDMRIESCDAITKIEDIDHVEEQLAEHIEDNFNGLIQEDDCSGNFTDENSNDNDNNNNDEEDDEEIHLEEEEDSINSDAQIDDNGENSENVLLEVNTLPSEDYIVPEIKSDPLEKIKNENRSHICIKCDKDFSTKTNLMRHMLTHDGVKPFQCNICGNGFTQNGSLKQHMLIHTGERPHKCDVCGRGFTQAKSLVFHMRRHTGEKPFTCEKCGLTFRQKDGLKRHVLMKHSGGAADIHVCSICQRVLHSKYSLALHMRKHLGNEDLNHKCEICEKTFSSKTSLDNHHRQHTGEKPFKCDSCGKEFSRKGSLISHIKTHLDVKPFRCPKCEKGFIHKHQVMSHMQTHKNHSAKSFQCGKCYKSFAIKRNLLQHLRNHNMESMTIYKCDDCNIAFNTKRGLKLHRFNEHKETVSDLNECDICHIPFVSVNDLNQHTIAVHDSIDERCEICDHQFTSKKLLEDHLLEHELMTVN